MQVFQAAVETQGFLAQKAHLVHPESLACLAVTEYKVRRVSTERSLERLQDLQVTEGRQGFKGLKAKLVIKETEVIQVSLVTIILPYILPDVAFDVRHLKE